MEKSMNDKKRRRATKVDYHQSKEQSTIIVESPKKRPSSSKKKKKIQFFILPSSNDGINISQLRTNLDLFKSSNNLLSTISRMIRHNFTSFRNKGKDITSTATTRRQTLNNLHVNKNILNTDNAMRDNTAINNDQSSDDKTNDQ
jgi:hypothetical protein